MLYTTPGKIVTTSRMRLVMPGRGKPSTVEAEIVWVRESRARTVFLRNGSLLREGTLVGDLTWTGQAVEMATGTCKETLAAFRGLRDWLDIEPEVRAWMRDIPLLPDPSPESVMHNRSPTTRTRRYLSVASGTRYVPEGSPSPATRSEAAKLPVLAPTDGPSAVVWKESLDSEANRALAASFHASSTRDAAPHQMAPSP